jgi:predicted  nucleic acid-binding Zn-ribbon protein
LLTTDSNSELISEKGDEREPMPTLRNTRKKIAKLELEKAALMAELEELEEKAQEVADSLEEEVEELREEVESFKELLDTL